MTASRRLTLAARGWGAAIGLGLALYGAIALFVIGYTR